MIIYQTSPRLVFQSNNIVYKFFKSSKDCKIELEKIVRSPLSREYDAQTKYTMCFVKLIGSNLFFYKMAPVTGHLLSLYENLEDYVIAGAWLRVFHKQTFEKTGKVFLFGDYSLGHIYIDKIKKKITTIDPGTGFGDINYLENDIARFIVDLFQINSLNFLKLNHSIKYFFNGYHEENINFERLTKILLIRIKRNFFKRLKLGKGKKRYLSAPYWLMISLIKYKFFKFSFKNKKLNP
jgi:hypothetical protein